MAMLTVPAQRNSTALNKACVARWKMAAEYADAWIKGRRDFPQKVPVAVEVVTADNVGEYGDYGAKDDARPAPN